MGHFCWMFCEEALHLFHQGSSNVWLLPPRTWLYSQPSRRNLRRRNMKLLAASRGHTMKRRAFCGTLRWVIGEHSWFYGEWFWFWLMFRLWMRCVNTVKHPNMGALHIFPHWYSSGIRQALSVVQRLHPTLLASAQRFSVALNAMAIPVDEVRLLA